MNTEYDAEYVKRLQASAALVALNLDYALMHIDKTLEMSKEQIAAAHKILGEYNQISWDYANN